MAELFTRASSHFSASSSSGAPAGCGARRIQAPAVRHCRSQRIVTRAGLFDPPPFRPDKLTVMFSSPGVSKGSLPSTRRYTLTHNDITGALRLTVGPDYNYQQISGFYTRLLRDEVVAEWRFGGPQPSLHIYCHVSGEEKWLAPPMLRNYIFRREMPLVLDTLMYADRQLLAQQPSLTQADVYVHFQSCEQELDRVELWGTLGQRSTWQPVPTSVLKRTVLALLGFKVMPQAPTSPARAEAAQRSLGSVGSSMSMSASSVSLDADEPPYQAEAQQGPGQQGSPLQQASPVPSVGLKAVSVVAAMDISSGGEGSSSNGHGSSGSSSGGPFGSIPAGQGSSQGSDVTAASMSGAQAQPAVVMAALEQAGGGGEVSEGRWQAGSSSPAGKAADSLPEGSSNGRAKAREVLQVPSPAVSLVSQQEVLGAVPKGHGPGRSSMPANTLIRR